MNLNCQNDDSGECCGKCPYNVVAVIPCLGRFQLLRQTVNRLVNKNRVKVLLVGNEHGVKVISEEFKTYYLQHENTKLGEKWNAGFRYARILKPDAVLFVGSSDWVEDGWIANSLPLMKDHDMVGTLGCYLLDVSNTRRLVHWPGYGKGLREQEPIGIGRLISARILDKFNWEPFDANKDNSMDWQMWQNVLNNGGKVKIIEGKSLSLSTDRWPNKHRFEEHWRGQLPSQKIVQVDEFIKTNFPEANNIF